MVNGLWFRVVEVWMVNKLLQSPAFHRTVRAVHKRLHEARHGKDPEQMGGTNIDKAGDSKLDDAKRFWSHYLDEVKEQLNGRQPPKR
ncbi:hypothetical protein MMC09_006761 [Bachmanniomyces sp. S44760]|nr:hypothetical protein [Bachmanniomyces sp. S44760]